MKKINMEDYGLNFGSTIYAKLIFKDIDSKSKENKLILNFQKVKHISSSFATTIVDLFIENNYDVIFESNKNLISTILLFAINNPKHNVNNSKLRVIIK